MRERIENGAYRKAMLAGRRVLDRSMLSVVSSSETARSMNQFSASDQLVEQLLANGFAEVTEQYFPHCHVRLQLKGEAYHPAYFQRAFRLSAGTALIILHYLTIRVLYKSHVVAESRRLSEEELQTIMAFCKLPAKRQAVLAARRLSLADLKSAVDAEPRLAD